MFVCVCVNTTFRLPIAIVFLRKKHCAVAVAPSVDPLLQDDFPKAASAQSIPRMLGV